MKFNSQVLLVLLVLLVLIYIELLIAADFREIFLTKDKREVEKGKGGAVSQSVSQTVAPHNPSHLLTKDKREVEKGGTDDART